MVAQIESRARYKPRILHYRFSHYRLSISKPLQILPTIYEALRQFQPSTEAKAKKTKLAEPPLTTSESSCTNEPPKIDEFLTPFVFALAPFFIFYGYEWFQTFQKLLLVSIALFLTCNHNPKSTKEDYNNYHSYHPLYKPSPYLLKEHPRIAFLVGLIYVLFSHVVCPCARRAVRLALHSCDCAYLGLYLFTFAKVFVLAARLILVGFEFIILPCARLLIFIIYHNLTHHWDVILKLVFNIWLRICIIVTHVIVFLFERALVPFVIRFGLIDCNAHKTNSQ